jgi:hypothetical protein
MSVALVGLVWDDYDLQRPDLDVMFELTEGLDELTGTRGDDQVIPFRAGRLAQSRTADRRPLVGSGWVTGRTPTAVSAYRAYVDGLKAKLDPTGPPKLLVATLEDGSKRWISAVPRDLIGGPGSGADYRPFSIQWDGLDPFWYSPLGQLTLDSGLLLDDGYVLDSSAEIVVSAAASLFDVIVVNPGSADTDLVAIRMAGASLGVVGIENATTGVGFSAGVALTAGQELLVDVRGRTIERAGVSVRSTTTLFAANQHGEFFRLRPGTNRIRITGKPTETRLLFNPAWQ